MLASGGRADLDRLRHESDQPVAEQDCPSTCDTEAQSDNCFQPIVLVRHNVPRTACNATMACLPDMCRVDCDSSHMRDYGRDIAALQPRRHRRVSAVTKRRFPAKPVIGRTAGLFGRTILKRTERRTITQRVVPIFSADRRGSLRGVTRSGPFVERR